LGRLWLYQQSERAAPGVPFASGFLNRLQHMTTAWVRKPQEGFRARTHGFLRSVALVLGPLSRGELPAHCSPRVLSIAFPSSPIPPDENPGCRNLNSSSGSTLPLDQVSKITFSLGHLGSREEKAVDLGRCGSAQHQGICCPLDHLDN